MLLELASIHILLIIVSILKKIVEFFQYEFDALICLIESSDAP